MRVLTVGVIWLCACFSPDERDGVIVCGEDDACPPGYMCGEHRKCWRIPPPAIDAGPEPHRPRVSERGVGMEDDGEH